MGAFWGSVRSVLPNVVEVIKRFPVPVLMALILTVWLLYGVYWKVDVYFITFALLTLFFASVGACLFAQHRKFESINQVLLSLGVCAFFASVYFLPDDMNLTTFMMPVALVLLASTIAFVGSEQENRSYWLFNHGFWFALIVAVLGGLLIAGLISMLLAAYALLFDVVVKSRAHQYSLIICLFLIAPLIWLSLLPQSFTKKVVEGEPEEFTAKITSLFVKYVFVPFFFLFALLFHALAIKVLIRRLFANRSNWLVRNCLGHLRHHHLFTGLSHPQHRRPTGGFFHPILDVVSVSAVRLNGRGLFAAA